MNEALLPLAWLGFTVLIVLAGILASRAYQRQLAARHAALVGIGFRRVDIPASGSGCLYALTSAASGGGLSSRMLDSLGHFGALQVGDSRAILNVYRRDDPGRRIYLFTYRYSTGSGKNRSTHTRDHLLVQMPLILPSIEWRTEHFGDRLVGFFGVRDIQFESAEFNERFHITAASPEYAFQIIHPQLMERMLAHFGLSWSVQGCFALTELSDLNPEAIGQALWENQAFTESLAPFVHEQFQAPPVHQQPDFGELFLAEVESHS